MTQQPDQSPAIQLDECPHCDQRVPVGTFCGNCGAHLTDSGGRDRLRHFAAAPSEHVAKTAVISTLFPHLPQRHAHIFREALILGLVVVVILAAVHLYAPALLAAAVLLPVLYLLYLYEVEVYEHEPLLVIAATFVVGAALGVGYTLITGQLFKATFNGTQQGVFLTGVLLPIIFQLLMLVGPLLLIAHRSFDEVLDGLTFGVASALGFTMAAVITGYWHVLTAPLAGTAGISTDEIAGILRAAILAALVNASTTGMICAALWQTRRARTRDRHTSPLRRVPGTLVVAFGAQILLGIVSYYIGSLLLLVAVWVVVAGVLLVWLRLLLHFALLDEGAEGAIGPPAACPECHRLVPTMLFCPACGVARAAGPKQHRQGAAQVTPVGV
ncbi:MAG: PrsW family intramembrane metalloprotease [Candidatus Dormibacteraeota bacterium]|nr:PrsW family intramembrane metalloprotease [Candidatus Dormibacteraeota bacterium]